MTTVIIIVIINNNQKGKNMTSRCEITGKGKQFGHNVSLSLHRTKRVFKPNLQKKTLLINGKKKTIIACAKAIRTLKKQAVK